jgi:8-amino-7-oxononanoate synthase
MNGSLDFTSALYLGLVHASGSLRPWAQLTTGKPAALSESPRARVLARRIAALQGCESATLSPSTLHLFWDLFGTLCGRSVAIFQDAGVYPIARWGVERAAAHGVPIRSFLHHDAGDLWRQIKTMSRARPIVVADGWCPGCGCAAPVADYLDIARRYGGLLILDDTQALGILGHSPGPDSPYGRGGGGSLRWSNVSGPDVLLGCSLAKGFGVPVATLSGSRDLIEGFESKSETRTHSSPPSAAVIHAAEHALYLNEEEGDALRLRLAVMVRHFRERLTELGFSALGGIFPVQTLAPMLHLDAMTLHEQLRRNGIRTVLHRSHNGRSPRISFLINAQHTPRDLDLAVSALISAVENNAEVLDPEASYEI